MSQFLLRTFLSAFPPVGQRIQVPFFFFFYPYCKSSSGVGVSFRAGKNGKRRKELNGPFFLLLFSAQICSLLRLQRNKMFGWVKTFRFSSLCLPLLHPQAEVTTDMQHRLLRASQTLLAAKARLSSPTDGTSVSYHPPAFQHFSRVPRGLLEPVASPLRPP